MNILWVDRFGGFASTMCAAHCLLVAAAPSLFVLLGVTHDGHAAFEWSFFILAAIFAVGAAVAGYRRHQNKWTVAGFALALPLLAAGRFGEAFHLHDYGFALTVSGGLLLATAHIRSLWQTRTAIDSCCD